MVVTGHVENGQIVLDVQISLPEGTKVEITPVNGEIANETEQSQIPTLYERFKDVIGIASDLPEDFAINHDHYIHGTEKRQ